MKKRLLFNLLTMLSIIIGLFLYYRFYLNDSRNQKITTTINMGLLTGNWTLNVVDSTVLHLEGALKAAVDFNENRIRITSHGSATSLNKNTPNELASQIINGIYNTNPSWFKSGIIISDSFNRLLKSGQDITIELDACNTGAYYKDENGKKRAFADDLAIIIKSEILRQGYNNKVTVRAPNGLISWNLGFDHISKPNVDPYLNGSKGKINEFIY